LPCWGGWQLLAGMNALPLRQSRVVQQQATRAAEHQLPL
jgi:hypothetical protein